jgi:hypothetical protein
MRIEHDHQREDASRRSTPSQLLWTYGPGALIDLPSLSVVTLGIDRWEKDRCQPIQEARLLAAVRKVLGTTGREPADAAVPEE